MSQRNEFRRLFKNKKSAKVCFSQMIFYNLLQIIRYQNPRRSTKLIKFFKVSYQRINLKKRNQIFLQWMKRKNIRYFSLRLNFRKMILMLSLQVEQQRSSLMNHSYFLSSRLNDGRRLQIENGMIYHLKVDEMLTLKLNI